MSFVYERGWRQGFSWGGFPGEAVEYEMAMDYLQSTFGGVRPLRIILIMRLHPESGANAMCAPSQIESKSARLFLASLLWM